MTTTTVLPSGVERKVERFCFEVNQFFFSCEGLLYFSATSKLIGSLRK